MVVVCCLLFAVFVIVRDVCLLMLVLSWLFVVCVHMKIRLFVGLLLNV